MNEVPFFIATILAKLLSGKYIFSTILTPVRKNTHTYENILAQSETLGDCVKILIFTSCKHPLPKRLILLLL